MGKKEKPKSVAAKPANKNVGQKGSNCCLIISSIIAVSLALLSYKVYTYVMYVPEMPQVSLDEWWGPNNTKLAQDTSVRPFRIVFSDAMEADLRKRFENYRQILKQKSFKEAGWTYGVNSEGFGQFFAHWVFHYNFKERERFLNQYNHFKTNVQGLDIHFVHVKPKIEKNVKVLPLLLLHGWPGSFREFYDAIPLLTTPREDRDFVFELIVPSLPGYGYSQAPVRRGLSTAKVAVVMRNLMKRLGFNQFYVQGGDMGHQVASSMVTLFPEEILGFHTNMAFTMNKVNSLIWVLGGLIPGLDRLIEKDYTDRYYPLKERLEFYLEESGYIHMHYTKPDTWGVALHESPAGLAGYILEKFILGTSYDGKFKEDGGLEGVFSKEALLDNIMIYWATGTITTSMRLYTEKMNNPKLENDLTLIPSQVPTWALRLKHEIFFTPEWLIKWKYPNLLGTTTLEEGGHFAAMEKPVIFADDVFEAVEKFQEFYKRR